MTNGVLECRVINSLVHSQAELHSAYGGVFPSLAKREHGKNLVPLMRKLLDGLDSKTRANESESRKIQGTDRLKGVLESFGPDFPAQNPDLFESFTGAEFLNKIPAIDRIAVTEGPGLEPALWVGINFARVLGALWNKPVIPVNHMEGHIVGSLLNSDVSNDTWQKLKSIEFPAVALLISGGHTELVRIDNHEQSEDVSDLSAVGQRQGGNIFRLRYSILGQTKDDAVGEAFDKVARLLGLPYPGGPHVSKLSHDAWEEKIESPVKLPRPMLQSGDLDFSFSGLKTAVLYAVRKHTKADGKLSDDFKKGLAREFEDAVTETLDSKLRNAIETVGARTIIVGGGVSANIRLRKQFEITAAEFGIPLLLPSRHISGDNALMIALAGAMDSTTTPNSVTLRAHGTKKLGKQINSIT